MVKMENVPTEVLLELSRKSFDWVLSHLAAETLFDVPAINVLMCLGKEAIDNELERRRIGEMDGGSEPVIVPCEPFNDAEVDAAVASLFGGVLDVSMEGSSSEELGEFEKRVDGMGITTKGVDDPVEETPAERPPVSSDWEPF